MFQQFLINVYEALDKTSLSMTGKPNMFPNQKKKSEKPFFFSFLELGARGERTRLLKDFYSPTSRINIYVSVVSFIKP